MLASRTPHTSSVSMYGKRPGTSGIRGQLYETKLISLIYFRALHDGTVKDFHLSSNNDKTGAFDDICFRAKFDGCEKPVAVFIQAKHRENEKQKLNVDLVKYFDSYLKIRQSFQLHATDLLFEGSFDDMDCAFVLYTTAADEHGEHAVEGDLASHIDDLIGTGGTAKQLHKNAEDVELLCKIAVKDQVTSLARHVAMFASGEGNCPMMMSDELVLRYHVILANKVLNVSDVQAAGQRTASFRPDFFDTNDEYLVVFKDTLYTEMLKRRKVKDVNTLLSDFLAEPGNVTKLSKLIGNVLTYNNGLLDFVKKSSADWHRRLSQVHVSQSTVDEAVALAAKEILSTREFKVPASFGNKDLTISSNEAKQEKRLNYLTSKIIDLSEKYKSNRIIIIDESLEKGFLRLNGGISGAIGNLLVLDDNPKLMRITDDFESLGPLAKGFYEKLKIGIDNLHEYKFCFEVNDFPKLSFSCNDHEEHLTRGFLDKILLYTNQADEQGVEEILKSEIEENQRQREQASYFQVRIDAMFLKYHDEIQKWWMLPAQAPYLTKNSNLFENATTNIIKDLLLSSINIICTSQIKQLNYTFTEDAVSCLRLRAAAPRTVVITDNSELTAGKVMQCLDNRDHVVLDVEYILNLPMNDRNALRTELTNTHENKVIIFVCDNADKLKISGTKKKTLENIANAVQNKSIIIIANKVTANILQKYFKTVDNVIYEQKNSLIDFTEESGTRILEDATVIFQGKEIPIDAILDYEARSCVEGEVLSRIMNKQTIKVSQPIRKRYHYEKRPSEPDRRFKKSEDLFNDLTRTLYDMEDNVVNVVAEPGTGTSDLLTLFSIQAKEIDPTAWIVRVDVLQYTKLFNQWKEHDTDVGLLETLHLMCHVVLQEKLGVADELDIELGQADGAVHLTRCEGGPWEAFELKLFLHLFARGKMIFQFDCFDEILPQFTREVIKCIKSIRQHSPRHRVWVTSRFYKYYDVFRILRQEFDSTYEIDYFSFIEQNSDWTNFGTYS